MPCRYTARHGFKDGVIEVINKGFLGDKVRQVGNKGGRAYTL